MNRTFIACAALFALSGAAFAQQSPVFQGNYSANVIATYDRDADTASRMSASIGTFGASQRSTAEIRDGSITWDLADRADNRGL
jgi:hypothetical protein